MNDDVKILEIEDYVFDARNKLENLKGISISSCGGIMLRKHHLSEMNDLTIEVISTILNDIEKIIGKRVREN